MKRLAILLLGVALYVSAQIPDPELTGQFFNGRFWGALSDTQKLHFVMGLGQGISLGPPGNLEIYLSVATYGELVKGINQFYGDPANGAIPIVNAMVVFAKKMGGSFPEEIEELTAEFRRRAKDASDAAPAPRAPPPTAK